MKAMDPISYETVALEMLKVYSQQAIAGAFLRDTIEPRARWDYAMDSLVMGLSAFVLKEDVPAEWEYVYYVPATWWDHLKISKRFPRWLERRYPARFSKRVAKRILTYQRTYPHASLRKPLGPPVLKLAVRTF